MAEIEPEAVLEFPMRVVRLEVPLAVVEARLGGDPTSGRAADLEVARRAVAEREGEGLEDLTVDNDRRIGEVAADIVRWLGWT